MEVAHVDRPPLVGLDLAPVVYVGRSDVALPDGVPGFDDGDVHAATMADLLADAPLLVILDALSFPYEVLSDEQWAVPMLVCLPHDMPSDDAVRVLEPALSRMGFFDLFAVRSDAEWDVLRRAHPFATSQRAPAPSDDPAAVVDFALDLVQRDVTTADAVEAPERYESVSYWRKRGEEVGPLSQHRAICSVHHDLRFNKAMHQAQADALVPQFDEVRTLGAGRDLAILEIGAGVGRWATAFRPDGDRYTGVDISASMVEIARLNFPEHEFHVVDEDGRLPHEANTFDLVMSVTVLHHNPLDVRRALIREMWRVTKPAGHILLLEQVVAAAPRPDSTVYRMSVSDLVMDVHRASLGRVVLEHAEAVRYPHDEMYRSVLLRLTKLGRAATW